MTHTPRTIGGARAMLGRATPWLLPLALATLVLALDLSTRSQVHTFDALSYIRDVNQGAGFFFHPHHLLYSPSGWLFWQLWRGLGYTGDAELPLQTLNSLACALCSTVMYRLVYQLTSRWWAALTASGLLVFNYGVWYFSVEVEVYLLALIWLLLALALLFAMLHRPRAWNSALLGGTVGMATLYHQTNGLLVPIVVLAVLLSPLSWRGRLMALLTIGAISSAIVALGYLLVGFGFYGFHSLRQLVDWMFFFVRTGWWGHPNSDWLGDVRQGLRGSISPLGARRYWLAIVALGLLGGAGALRRWPREIAICCAWITIYAIFFSWWEADNIEFWIATLLPLWLLAGLCVAACGTGWQAQGYRWGQPAAAVLACALPLLLVWHNQPLVRQRGDPRADYQRTVAARVHAASTHGDLILAPGGLQELYLPYYEDRPYVRTLNGVLFDTDGDIPAAFARLRSAIDTNLQAGLAVLVGRDMLVLPQELHPRYPTTQAQLDAFWQPYRSALLPIFDDQGRILFWRIAPANELAAGDGWRWQSFALGWLAANLQHERFTHDGWCFDPQVDPSLTSPLLALPAAQIRAIVVRMSTRAPHQRAQIFYAGPNESLREQHSISWRLTGDGAPHTYTIALAGAPGWDGTIVRLRLDPITTGDGTTASTTCVQSVRMLR